MEIKGNGDDAYLVAFGSQIGILLNLNKFTSFYDCSSKLANQISGVEKAIEFGMKNNCLADLLDCIGVGTTIEHYTAGLCNYLKSQQSPVNKTKTLAKYAKESPSDSIQKLLQYVGLPINTLMTSNGDEKESKLANEEMIPLTFNRLIEMVNASLTEDKDQAALKEVADGYQEIADNLFRFRQCFLMPISKGLAIERIQKSIDGLKFSPELIKSIAPLLSTKEKDLAVLGFGLLGYFNLILAFEDKDLRGINAIRYTYTGKTIYHLAFEANQKHKDEKALEVMEMIGMDDDDLVKLDHFNCSTLGLAYQHNRKELIDEINSWGLSTNSMCYALYELVERHQWSAVKRILFSDLELYSSFDPAHMFDILLHHQKIYLVMQCAKKITDDGEGLDADEVKHYDRLVQSLIKARRLDLAYDFIPKIDSERPDRNGNYIFHLFCLIKNKSIPLQQMHANMFFLHKLLVNKIICRSLVFKNNQGMTPLTIALAIEDIDLICRLSPAASISYAEYLKSTDSARDDSLEEEEKALFPMAQSVTDIADMQTESQTAPFAAIADKEVKAQNSEMQTDESKDEVVAIPQDAVTASQSTLFSAQLPAKRHSAVASSTHSPEEAPTINP